MTTRTDRLIEARDVLLDALKDDRTRNLATSIALTVLTLACDRGPQPAPEPDRSRRGAA